MKTQTKKKLPICKIKHLPIILKKTREMSSSNMTMRTSKLTKIGDMDKVSTLTTLEKI